MLVKEPQIVCGELVIWDVETCCGDSDQIEKFMPPFEPPKHPGKFDPSTVKCGNLGAEKAAAKRADAKRAHEKAVSDYESNCKQLEEEHRQKFISNASLDAVTGRVIASGYLNVDSGQVTIDGLSLSGEPRVSTMFGETWVYTFPDEARVIERFWRVAEDLRERRTHIAGLNIFDFDLPFMIRRSWLLGVDVPDWVFRNRYYDSIFVDLRKIWLCGQRDTAVRSSFDHLGAAFGTGGKDDGIHGDQFAELWMNDRKRAVAYLENDLRQPAQWAQRMGVL